MTSVISGGNYYWLIPAAVAQLIAILMRSQRWAVLLDRKYELEASVWSQGIGYLFTNLFPFRLGEVARVLVMSERCKMPIVQVAGTAIVERLLDVGTMIFALVIPFGEKYSVSSALALTLIAHIVYYILSTLLGILALWRIGQSFSDLMGLVARKNATV
jgi:hypothetical protein